MPGRSLVRSPTLPVPLDRAGNAGSRRREAGPPSLELRRRAEGVLTELEGHPLPAAQWRAFRAIEVLEHIGTPEARRVLKRMAGGAWEARQTREAKASLARLAKRAPARPR